MTESKKNKTALAANQNQQETTPRTHHRTGRKNAARPAAETAVQDVQKNAAAKATSEQQSTKKTRKSAGGKSTDKAAAKNGSAAKTTTKDPKTVETGRQKAAQPAQEKVKAPKKNGARQAGKNTVHSSRAQKGAASVGQATGVPGARRGAKKGDSAVLLPAADNRNAHRSRKNSAANVPVRIIPLGGLGEVGKNMTLYECQGDMFLVDCGSLFPDSEMLGVDLVIPDFTYAMQNISKIKGIVITHGHEDHTGALPYFLKENKVPVYGTRLTLGLVENKLREHNLLGDVELRLVTPGQKFNLGCFEIDPLRVNHSIPDAIALAITCPAGTIIQTGDFKIDYTPVSDKPINLAQFAAYGERGVLALLSDSTNAERPGYSNSERTVGRSFELLFGMAENKRIIIATFASNIQRIQQIFNMAVKYDRKVAVSGRSMINNIDMALELGYLQAPATLLIDIETINNYPPEKLVVVTTGSQGEPLSALSRMSGGMHRNVRIGVGDFVIFSSKPIPGNEKMVGKVVNSLMKQGADVIYESMYDVHTSGHACQGELSLMMSLVKPKYFIPVHGEYKQLKKHADLALGMGIEADNIHIPDIGECIALSDDALRMEASVPSGKTLVDGLGIGDVGSVVLRDRQHLSQDGLVIVVATVDSISGEVLSGPDIVSRGFVYVRENEDLIDDAKKCVNDVFYACWAGGVRDWSSVKSRIREEVSQLLYRRTKRSPMVLPILMEV